MKKLILLLFILPIFCFAQTNVTPQWKKNVSFDSLGYSITGSIGNHWLYDAHFIRANYIKIGAGGTDTTLYKRDDSIHNTDRTVDLKLHTLLFKGKSTTDSLAVSMATDLFSVDQYDLSTRNENDIAIGNGYTTVQSYNPTSNAVAQVVTNSATPTVALQYQRFSDSFFKGISIQEGQNGIVIDNQVDGYSLIAGGSIDTAKMTSNVKSYVTSEWAKAHIAGYAGGGFVPTSRTLSINGTSLDLSSNRSWSVGTVTSITPAYGFTSSTPITISGTLTTDSTKLQTVLNFFPKADTRYLRKSLVSGMADPSATIGLTANNGGAITAMRSDATPALSQSIIPTWTGLHTFSAGLNASNIAVGSTPATSIGVWVNKTLTSIGNSAKAFQSSAIYDSNTTSSGASFYSAPSTTAASFTLLNSYGFIANGITIGAGSTVTNQYGFLVPNNLNTATNNYGYYGTLASAANVWNIYMAGTATNYLAGNTGIGTTSTTGRLNLGAGTATVAPIVLASGTNLTSALAGAIEFDGTNIYYTNSSATRNTLATLSSPAFTGTPTVPTQATTDSSLNAASTEYVKKNFQATVTYFTPGMFSGAGTSASKYNWGTATIPASALSATGTASSTTYLRGDNTWATISAGMTNPMTTTGDIIYSSSGSTPARLAIGGSGTVLHGGTTPSYSAVSLTSDVTGLLPNANLANSTISGINLGSNLAALTQGTGISPFSYTGAAAATVAIDQTFAPNWTGQHIWQNNSASSSLTPYVKVANNTTGLTSAGTTYYSPAISLLSPVWNTSVSTNIEFRLSAQTNQSNNFGYFTISSYTGGASGTNVFQVDNFGNGFTGGSWGVHQFGLGTSTTTDGAVALNFTAATSGTTVQNTPVSRAMGAFWNTTSAANNWTEWLTGVRNTSGTSTSYTSKYYWAERTSTNNSGAYTDLMSLDNSSNLALLNTVSTKHIIGSSGTPTIAAGTGAGTSPTVSVSGTDMSGIVNVTTGTTPTGSNAIVGTITFNTAYGSAPKGVVLTPANTNSAALATTTQVFVPANGQTNGTTTTTFVVESNGTALAASTAYIWTYQVIQ